MRGAQDTSTLQQPVLPLDVPLYSSLHVLSLNMSVLQKVVAPRDMSILHVTVLPLETKRCPIMDEGTLKTPIPKCRLYWSFLFGVV